jgi:hypothetical protein
MEIPLVALAAANHCIRNARLAHLPGTSLKPLPKLVYIGGYGHSGSTLLEYLLSANPLVLACGEVSSAAREQMRKKRCTCGKRTRNCEVWGRFAVGNSATWRHQDLVLALLRHGGGSFSVLTDSSKTAWGAATVPFALRRKLGRDFALLHIVREPKAVCWSALKKAERQAVHRHHLLRCTIAALGWSAANLACQLFGWRYPDQYRLIRYESLVRSPRDQLSSIGDFLGFQGDWPAGLGVAKNRHQLYGNRMRSRPPAWDEIVEERSWQKEMPRRYRKLVDALTWPLRRRLGKAENCDRVNAREAVGT